LGKYLFKRILTMVVTLIVVSLVVFLMARVTGDPRSVLISDLTTQEQYAAMTEKFGLNKSWAEQYWIFVSDGVRGDFGVSTRDGLPVWNSIKDPLKQTLQIGAAAFFFALLIGVPLGVLSATSRGKVSDQILRFFAMIGQATPPFWLGIMLIFFFAVKLGWVPPSGRGDWKTYILPTVTLGSFQVATNLRFVRSSMLSVLGSEYIKLARAKGVSRRVIIWKHAFRNALIPLITYWGVNLGTLIAGSVVAEVVFVWPGMGRLAYIATSSGDYPLLQAVVMVFSVGFLITSLAVDLIYAAVDPRIRRG
jgi:peptide/nickel transport system permease protein